MKNFILIAMVLAVACKQKPGGPEKVDAVPTAQKDPHSQSNPGQAIVRHLDLDLTVDFGKQELSGKAVWTIDNFSKGSEIIFDANHIVISKITTGDNEAPAAYTTDEPVKYLGQAVHVPIAPDTKKVSIYYHTTKDATAVQWLQPAQTAGKKHPFLFTQSESILARTWVPSQDGPGVRFTYNARITVPKELLAVMSAENPQVKNDSGVYTFKQTHPIPSYLLALAVGDIAFKAIDSRTGVYAEPSVLEKAAWEFADMGKMATAAEKIYIPYRWGRYDVLVLPPSFPFGGMENPNLTFATPTLIAGDRSLVSVIAHELAHSWTGNLVTNASWNDMWLNEGFTVYFERRIVESVYGKDEMKMHEVLGREDLVAEIKATGDTSRDTQLKGEFNGRDPDDAISGIPYEKGYAFLRTIEEAVGREKFDAFLKEYLNENAFKSVTTEQFLHELRTDLLKNDTALENKIRIQQWVYEPGLPENAPGVSSEKFRAVDSVMQGWEGVGGLTGMAKRFASTNERLYFISHLPASINSEKLGVVDKEFNFTNSGNAEIQAAWYALAVKKGFRQADQNIEKFLTSVGRRKFLVPIYREMIATPEGKKWAQQVYEKAKSGYHPLAVQTIGTMVK